MSDNKLFLIDGHALCYRAFYAIKGLANSHGQPTNAVYGFVSTIKKILSEYDPKYMAICFDSKGKTRREEKFAEYKIQRPKMPDDLISQIPLIKKVMDAYHIASFEESGFEADDLIATLAQKALAKKIKVVVVSDDKDLYQLANKNVSFLNRKNEMLGLKDLEEKLGFSPNRISDFIGLAGDSTDNIPGVKGIGKVTASKLINEYGTLEKVMKNAEKIAKDSVRSKLLENKDMAVLSKELAELELDIPVTFDMKALECNTPDREQLFELFKELEFRRLADEYSGAPAQEFSSKVSEAKDAKKIITHIKKAKQFSFLIEEEGDAPGLYVAYNDSEAHFLGDSAVDLKSIFEDEGILKITFNLKSALQSLEKYGIVMSNNSFDCMLAGYLLGHPHSRLNVRDLAWEFLKANISKDETSGADTLASYQLYAVLQDELAANKLTDLLETLEKPLSYVLYDMEREGVCLDVPFLEALSKDCQKTIDQLTKKIFKLADGEFNLNSPKQLSHVLFEKLGLPVIKKTKTGFSTNEEVLNILAKDHKIPSLILEYRHLAKIKSTYIDALPQLINEKTNRLHAEFDQAGTETGRLSSRNPNLQNLPIRTDLGRQIRKAIIASDKKNVLVAADYSQIELRVLAHLTNDPGLLKAFKEGEDIHTYTASLIFDIDEKDVDYHKRDTAKRVNFGIIYGMSAFGLAKDLNISQEQAHEFIDRYFVRYPNVKQFMDDTIAHCEAEGYVTTLLNRRRYIPDINNRNNAIKQYAQRQAINTPVQGSAADLIKIAMINVKQALDKSKLTSKMIMTVHDELVFDVLKSEQNDLATLVRKEMEGVMKLSVPISVSIKSGNNWLEMKEI